MHKKGQYNLMFNLRRGKLTSSTLVAQVGKPPDVAQAYGKTDAGQEEVQLASPCSTVILPVLGQAGTGTHAGVRARHGGKADVGAFLHLQPPHKELRR